MNLRRKNIYLENLLELERETEKESDNNNNNNVPTEINEYVEQYIVGGAGELIYGTIIFDEKPPEDSKDSKESDVVKSKEITNEDKIQIYTKLIKSITNFSKKWKREQKSILSCGTNTINTGNINIEIENKIQKYETSTS